MTIARFFRRAVLLGAVLALPLAAADISAEARRIHFGSLVLDGHVHVANRQFYHGGNMGDRLDGGQFDLPRAREGGVKAMFYTVFVTEEYYPPRYETKQVLRLIDTALEQIELNRATIELARNATEIERITARGKMAAVLDIEGGWDLDGDLGVLRNLYRLGVRVAMLPAHNWTNNFADSCCAPPKWNGLNARGRAVMAEMNRLGMLINVSHASDVTIEQAIDASKDPIVATHHGLRSFNNIPRNLPDALAKKLAAKGGVIGFQIGNEFHNVRVYEYRKKATGKTFWDRSAIGKKEGRLSIEQIDRIVAPQFPMMGCDAPDDIKLTPDGWVQVVERAIALVGEDHVALGTDIDGGPTLPRGMSDIRDLPLITDAMVRRGWPETRIKKFLGGNLLRVFRQVTEKRNDKM
jgi:membrane dipeptidase